MGGCASVPIKFKKAEAGGVPPEPATEESAAAPAPVEEQKTAEEVKTEVEETKEEVKAETETETEKKAEDEKDAPSLGTLLDKVQSHDPIDMRKNSQTHSIRYNKP